MTWAVPVMSLRAVFERPQWSTPVSPAQVSLHGKQKERKLAGDSGPRKEHRLWASP